MGIVRESEPYTITEDIPLTTQKKISCPVRMPKFVPVDSLFKRMRGQWCVVRTRRGKRALFKIVRMSAREGNLCLSDASHQVVLSRLAVGKGVGKFKRAITHNIIMGGEALQSSPPILFQATASLAGLGNGRGFLNLEAWDPPSARVLRAWRESQFTPRTQEPRLGDLPRGTIEAIAVYTAVMCQDETADIIEDDDDDDKPEYDSDSTFCR